MEIIGEFIFEIVLEGIFGLTVENPKVKTWVKTVAFLVISQLFTAAMAWLTYQAWKTNNDGWIVVAIIAVAWCIGTLISSIYGHKRNWVQARG